MNGKKHEREFFRKGIYRSVKIPHLILNTAVTKVKNANSSAKEDWKGYQCVLRFIIIFGSH